MHIIMDAYKQNALTRLDLVSELSFTQKEQIRNYINSLVEKNDIIKVFRLIIDKKFDEIMNLINPFASLLPRPTTPTEPTQIPVAARPLPRVIAPSAAPPPTQIPVAAAAIAAATANLNTSGMLKRRR